MKAEELRVDNIISIGGKYHRITQITSAPFRGITTKMLDGHKGMNCSLGDSSVQPIPLTEEWLVKFGFIQRSDMKECYLIPCVDDRYFAIHIFNGSFDLIIETDKDAGRWAILCRKISSVHQLQNLYFALTGEELKLK